MDSFGAELDVPVGEIKEVFPAFMLLKAEVHLDERTPLRSFGLADEMHARFVRGAIGLSCITGDAGTNNVLPRRRASSIPRDDMIEIQILAVEAAPAVLARVAVAFENVMPRELDLLLRHPIEQRE